jgi:hypothetical protein
VVGASGDVAVMAAVDAVHGLAGGRATAAVDAVHGLTGGRAPAARQGHPGPEARQPGRSSRIGRSQCRFSIANMPKARSTPKLVVSGPGLARLAGVAAVAAVTAVAASSTIGLLAATQSAAHAHGIGLATNTLIISNSSWLNVAVRGGSTAAGTDIIQWPSTLGSEQRWNDDNTDRNTYIHYLQNVNSGMSFTTDGVAGDPLFQEPCDPNNTHGAVGRILFRLEGSRDRRLVPHNQLNQVSPSPGQAPHSELTPEPCGAPRF